MHEADTKGMDPTPGVDTTQESLAKKYGTDVPKDVKQVLNDDGTSLAQDSKKTSKRTATAMTDEKSADTPGTEGADTGTGTDDGGADTPPADAPKTQTTRTRNKTAANGSKKK